MRLAVVGTGLIGASFAAAARAAGLCSEIVGVDPVNGAQALALGYVDRLADEVPAAVDAVLLATPADAIVPWLLRLQHHDAILFDVGSVKAALVAQLDAAGVAPPPCFVPCHPIAGSERSGPDAASADLFTDRLLVVTPLPGTDPAAVARVSRWWEAVGARVRRMAPEAHDATFALTSHLPHLAAFAYMQLIEDDDLAFGAGGFRDFSRIAASDPDMWVPILRLNRRAILASLAALQEALADMGRLIEQDDEAALRARLSAARERRRRFSL